MVTIVDREPERLFAGDSWAWSKTLADYPSPTWTLTYYFRCSVDNEVRSIVATADGNGGHAVSETPANSGAYPPGRHSWSAVVDDGSDVFTIERGFAEVVADFSKAEVDHRTYNERVLDAIEAVREGRASTDQESMSISDRSIGRMSWDELEQVWHRFRQLVAKERGIKAGRHRVRL